MKTGELVRRKPLGQKRNTILAKRCNVLLLLANPRAHSGREKLILRLSPKTSGRQAAGAAQVLHLWLRTPCAIANPKRACHFHNCWEAASTSVALMI